MKMNQAFKAIFIALIMAMSVVSFALAEDNATGNVTSDLGEIENQTATVSQETAELENDTANVENNTPDDLGTGNTSNETPNPVEITAGEENKTSEEAPKLEQAEIPKNETPSINPDNTFLWGLKRAIEKIDYLVTIGKSAKAQKGLAHARERLLEVQAMIAEKKFDAAEKAANAHKDDLEQAKNDIEQLGNGNTTAEMEKEQELQKEIQNQEQTIQNIKARFESNLSEQEKANIKAILASVSDSSSGIKIKVSEKLQKAAIKLKAQSEKEQQKAEEKKTDIKSNDSAKENKTSQDEQGQPKNGKNQKEGEE